MAEVRIVNEAPGCKVTSIEKIFGQNKYRVHYKKNGQGGYVDMDFSWGKKEYKNTNGWEATYS